jgi:hypothetical protein
MLRQVLATSEAESLSLSIDATHASHKEELLPKLLGPDAHSTFVKELTLKVTHDLLKTRVTVITWCTTRQVD